MACYYDVYFSYGRVFRKSCFYDSFLPLIVTEDRYNSVSAKGFTYGYIGSVILLIAILLMGNKPEWFGFADSQGAYRLGFLMVGIWWVGFAQYTLRFLPKDKRTAFTEKIISNGFNELKKPSDKSGKTKI